MMKYIARDAALTIGALVLLCGVGLAEDKKKAEPGKKVPPGTKAVVIHLDASKLSPELLAQLLKAAGGDGVKKVKGDEQKKPGIKKGIGQKKPDVKKPDEEKKPEGKVTKGIGLADAIGSAEKFTQGHAYKAEYADPGFRVEVKTGKGPVTVVMDPSGNILKALNDTQKGEDGDKSKKKGDEEKPRKRGQKKGETK